MRALVVYESMYGNTHAVAEAIGNGLAEGPHIDEVQVMPVAEADPAMAAAADLVVVGGPTHAHSMSRESSREQAIRDGRKPDSDLVVDPDAEAAEGVREWLATLDAPGTAAAAFDTRVDMAALITGRASKAIGRALRHHGFDMIVEPESFLVTKDNHLEPGEEGRARSWGRSLANLVEVPADDALRSADAAEPS